MIYYSFVANLIHCRKTEWKNAIPLDLGESPRFEKPNSPRSRGIPESSVSPDCLRMSRPRLIKSSKFLGCWDWNSTRLRGCQDRVSSRLRNLQDVQTETERDSSKGVGQRPRVLPLTARKTYNLEQHSSKETQPRRDSTWKGQTNQSTQKPFRLCLS